jgi:hypothetical protein
MVNIRIKSALCFCFFGRLDQLGKLAKETARKELEKRGEAYKLKQDSITSSPKAVSIL